MIGLSPLAAFTRRARRLWQRLTERRRPVFGGRARLIANIRFRELNR